MPLLVPPCPGGTSGGTNRYRGVNHPAPNPTQQETTLSRIVYLDTETTGLDPDTQDVWEIAIITDTGDEHTWMIRPDMTHADPKALEINRYHERSIDGTFSNPQDLAPIVAGLLAGAVVVGSNPAFDERFLTRWLRRHGQEWTAHYRTIDVTTLAHGYLTGCEGGYDVAANTPPNTHKVARECGIEPADYDRHTALGDARMVRDLYHVIVDESA